jgi:sugar lactone lactonase YvrE
MARSICRTAALAGIFVALLGCTPDAQVGGPREAAAADAPSGARKIAELTGLNGPEAVLYDPDQDLYFISNIVGFGSIKDGAGYIARVGAADLKQVQVFVQSGSNGVTLHAPKGMALQGDTLWVADIDAVRGFHRRTGAPLATVDLSAQNAMLLNDLTVGPDGTIYVTDTGIVMDTAGVIYRDASKIFRIAPDGTASLLPGSATIKHPNGIVWDARGNRLVVVNFPSFSSEVYALQGSSLQVLARGHGRFDGVVALPDGGLLVTAWSDSSVHLVSSRGNQRIIGGLSQPAALGLDSRRRRIAVPLVMINRVEFWALPDG